MTEVARARQERDGSGVVGCLSDEREERAEPEARTDTKEDGPSRRIGHAEVAAGHEPDGDRGDRESGDREGVRPIAECHANGDGHDRCDDRAERADEPVRSIGEPLVEQDETREPGESSDCAPTDGTGCPCTADGEHEHDGQCCTGEVGRQGD